MDMAYTPEQLAFQEEVRAWIASAMPKELGHKAAAFQTFSHEEVMVWHKVLAEKGWVAPNWPVEHGGTGWDIGQRTIFI
ncbi:MAG: acyl-CoA dehydrogenase family protein, partial [Planctomycetota bacterium]|nr:acyl-CoA dehydrogenase family protein [Planctomycetota bacterium]